MGDVELIDSLVEYQRLVHVHGDFLVSDQDQDQDFQPYSLNENVLVHKQVEYSFNCLSVPEDGKPSFGIDRFRFIGKYQL